MGAGTGHRGHPAPGTAARGRRAHGAARVGRLRLGTAGGGGPRRPRPRCERRLSPVAICPDARPGPELPPHRKEMSLPRAQTRSEPCGQSPLIRLPPPPTPAGLGGGERAKELRVRRRPGLRLRLLLLPWRRLVPLFGGRSGSLAGGGGRQKIPLGRRSGPRSQALQKNTAADLPRLPPGRSPGGGRRGGKLRLETLPPLQRPSSSLRTRLTGKHRFSPPTLAPLPLLPSPRLFSPPLPLSRMPLRRPRIG